MYPIHPPAYALEVLSGLEEAGFSAWFVGGCVRDSLLGRTPADWDIATSARPEQTAACFPLLPAVTAGEKHGTEGIVICGRVVEATTYRVDGDYTGHRRPEQVTFTARLEEDLARRDFTINAMAWHPEKGLVDCFGGLEDLSQGRVRCVGEPIRRFEEDALRILRCLRFGAVLGFSVEEETGRAALACRELLGDISGQRIREELTKLLAGPGAVQVIRAYAPIFFSALPELEALSRCAQESPYHCYGCWEHTLHAVDAVPPEPVLRWAALLHDCGKPLVKSFGPDGWAHFWGHARESVRLAKGLMERLRFSNQEAEAVAELIECHGEPLPLPEKRVKRLLARLGEEGLFRLLELMRGDVSAQAPALREKRLALLKEAEDLARDILRRGDCLGLPGLAVKGNDLIGLGYVPGKPLGQALNTLLEEVLSGELQNERPALLARAGELLKGSDGSLQINM